LEEFFCDEADSEVVGVTRDAVEKLTNAGAHVRVVGLPKSFAEVHSAHRTIMVYQAARFHREQFATHAQHYGPCVSTVLNEGIAISDATYQSALAHRMRFQNELVETFSGVDALLAPATPSSAPDLTTTGDLKFNSPWSLAGLPVVSLPVGNDSNGLPLAIQLIGRSQADGELLSLAEWCEDALPFDATPLRFPK
jgi:aspartyl-tRNA(Asn)/glutamyl-tRNA(Gln) amidotransferase subunit A